MNLQIIFLILIIFFQGCASIEEGEVDYVRTIANKSIDAKNKAKCTKELYSISEYTRAGVTRECYETLYRKYTKVPEIKKEETISVHLMQAFIGFADESANPSEIFRGKGVNAEMVVIANVCEQGVSGCSLRFGPESDKSGRVIYYSNGVKAQQYLNFSYLPVYGPIKYKGGPLIIQISILELDDLSEQQKNLLTTLAATGKKAYPPASSALSVLDKVGASLMSSSSDDIIFRYTMSLVPASSKLNYQSPIIAEGNYAFLRKNTWVGDLEKEVTDELKFDNLTGRLVQECNKDEQKITVSVDEEGMESRADYNPCTLDLSTGSNYKDYRGNTYLTFQIKSGFSENTLDNIQTFESLLTEINADKDAGALKVIEAFTELKEEVSRSKEQNTLLKHLDEIKKSLAIIPEDTFGLFTNQVFQLSVEYNKQIGQYNTLGCSANPMPDGCEMVMTAEQLYKVQLELRTVLNSINPTVSSITSIPAGFTILPASFNTDFKAGYEIHYNNIIFEQYLGSIESISNLAKNVENLKVTTKNQALIKSRQLLLKTEVKVFLNQLSKDLSLKAALSCTSIHSNTCYRYITSSQVTEVITIFNLFAQGYGVLSADLLTANAKSASENLKIISTLSVLQ